MQAAVSSAVIRRVSTTTTAHPESHQSDEDEGAEESGLIRKFPSEHEVLADLQVDLQMLNG